MTLDEQARTRRRGPDSRKLRLVMRRKNSSDSQQSEDTPPPCAGLPSTPASPSHSSVSRVPSHSSVSRVPSFRSDCPAQPSDEGNITDGVSRALGPRRCSMPNVVENFLTVPDESARLRRVRSFKTTSKGAVVNRGDSFKKKSTHSLMSTGSAITDARPQQLHHRAYTSGVASTPTYYRVIMMGAAGCGKSLMTKQFMTSDYVGSGDDHQETHENTVSVLLDGEESTIEFIDPLDRNVIGDGMQQLLDAYVVVFAINDSSTFETAQNLVRYLRVDHGTDRAIVLVANKIDLVRKRKVSAEAARLVAETYDCKYAEVSASLNHHLDELLVGILTQIRLHMRIPFTTISFPGKEPRAEKTRPVKGPRSFFMRLFRRYGRKSERPCENLHVL
ncbi:GTP-binding protein REM 1-like [Physella acuta]|uniref:GTP-binding protein REM 1-like n=1 Tax=Physella acuta TaxID=109671 RepID=UPI0027DBBF3F|nr:GTP-binding protein REM 1-like [Physella acuta]XP_059156717.1 GTP-binding protein REM 1-like [Physella acuta]XP_059156718.1 GTP-binding protein REM 1-like [Physella acuta]XP_059156719.1 GTP-binding protein REM 1-like [Physella acuta]